MNPLRFIQFAFLSAILLLISMRPSAQAGLFLETTFLPSYSQSNTGVGALGGNFDGLALSPESGFSYDLRNTFGWVFGQHLMLGFSYNTASAPLSRSASAGAASLDRKTTNSEYGPTLGYLNGNFRILATYILSGSKKRTETQVQEDGTKLADYTMENKGGTGYQIAVGYSFPLSSKLHIGPTLVYRKVTYSKQSLSNALDPTADYSDKDFSTKAVESNLLPMITLLLKF